MFDYRIAFFAEVRKQGDSIDLASTWQNYKGSFESFAQAIMAIIGDNFNDKIVRCVLCEDPWWNEDTSTDVDDYIVCNNCRDNCTSCDNCDTWSISDRYDWLTCIDGGYNYCEYCADNYASWCDECNEHYPNRNSEDHNHNRSCDCEPLPLNFQILANSHGVLNQDERLFIELPAGTIPDQALTTIINMLWREQFSDIYHANYEESRNYDSLDRTIRSLEPMWQTKQGNFTRRLSKALYQQHNNVKLDPGLLSRVGAAIRQHSGSTNSWHVEVTRDLNQGAEAFWHESSCWWGSESQSLCALKHWGGLALRSYSSTDQSSDHPSGRAWIQPLNEDMEPTQDVMGAHAYVVYNGYGDLEGYTAARLIAYLTSHTYRKIDFDAVHQYINSGGYLVADQETCDATTKVSIDNLNFHQKVAA